MARRHKEVRILFVILSISTLFACGPTTKPQVLRVEPGQNSIQDIVAQAHPGDIVQIAAGVYHESVRVDRRDITIRGEDRNAVVLDGQDRLTNGFVVIADGVAIENLTIHNFTQNGIVFNGPERASQGRGVDPNVDYGSGVDVLDRYATRYVTAHNNGLYGIYAFASRNGVIEDVYVSGHPDSGIYVGQCRPCNATVQRVVAEHNAIGYYGTNSSGGVVVAASIFRKNRLGIAPNSQKSEKLAPQAETTVVGNLVEYNDDPGAPMIAKGFFGGGIAIGGGTKNLVLRNVVRGNPFVGIGILTLEAYQPDNNRIIGNVATDNGVDLAYAPAGAKDGAGNCFSDNSYSTSVPAAIESVLPCDGSSSLASVPALAPRVAPGPVDYRKIEAPSPQATMPPERMTSTGGAGSWVPPDIDTFGLPS